MKETTLIILRHAHKAPSLRFRAERHSNESDLLRPLSALGLAQAADISKRLDGYDIVMIYSSSFARAVVTAECVAERKRLPVMVDDRFGERIKSLDQDMVLPDDFRQLQALDECFKLPGGESRQEVSRRFHSAVQDAVTECRGGCGVVFSHKNAITMYLMSHCQSTVMPDGTVALSFQGRTIFDGRWDGSPQGFLLKYQGDTLSHVEYF